MCILCIFRSCRKNNKILNKPYIQRRNVGTLQFSVVFAILELILLFTFSHCFEISNWTPICYARSFKYLCETKWFDLYRLWRILFNNVVSIWFTQLFSIWFCIKCVWIILKIFSFLVTFSLFRNIHLFRSIMCFMGYIKIIYFQSISHCFQ